MVSEVRRLEPDDWKVYRDIRLSSLADAPHAFGSTLAREERFDEATWRGRLGQDNVVIAVAFENGDAVGIMGSYVPPETGEAMLVAAWVHAGARGRGVADALVTEVLAWARERGFEQVVLRVADGNDSARRLFLRHGFTPTGQWEPLESDPEVGAEFLVRALR
jgi:ribosomal protein S18 acetylase RimI-like enzyme